MADMSDGEDPIDVVMDDKDKKTDDPGSLRCPPTSALELTGEQEEKMVTYAFERVEELLRETEDWRRERDNWIDEHENNFKHREKEGSTFEKSNSSFNQSRRNAIPVIARLTRDYLGTDPYFAVKPVRTAGSTIEADHIQNFSQYKLEEARLKETFEDGIEMAAVVGERVVKITYERDVELSEERAMVLVDEDGAPIRTSKGEPIYDYDQWVDSSFFQTPPTTPDTPQPGAPGKVAPDAAAPAKPWSLKSILPNWGKPKAPVPVVIPPTGEVVLRKDPSTKQPPDMKFVKTLYEKADVLFSGPRATGLAHGDFLCPLNARDIQSAPYIAHVFDMTVPEIIEEYYMSVDDSDLSDKEALFYDLLADKMEAFEGDSSEAKSEEEKPDLDNLEKETTDDKYNKRVKLAEVYMRADPKGTGFQKEIMAVIALDHKFALFYDYTPNQVAPGMRRPFRTMRVTPKRGRWWGISEYKLNQHKQNFIDWCLNEIVYANAADGKFMIYDPEMCEGWDLKAPEPGEKFHKLKKDSATKDPAKAVTYIVPPPVPKDLLDLMKNMMQSAQAERGNLAPGGDSMQDLPSSKLKYGIQAIQQAGDEVYALSAMNISRGMSDVLYAMIITMLSNMDSVEEFEYTDGDDYIAAQITRSDVEQLSLNVSLEMTLTRGDQIYQQNQMASQMVQGYLQLMPCDQAPVRDFYVQCLKSMDIQNAEKHVPDPSDSDIELSMNAKRGQWQMMAQGPQQQPGAPGQPPATAGQPAPGAPVISQPGQPPGPGTPPARRI